MTDQNEKILILQKWKDYPISRDAAEAAQMLTAQKSANKLAFLLFSGRYRQQSLVCTLARLCRLAYISTDERKVLFGGFVEDTLLLKLHEGNEHAVAIYILELFDQKNYEAVPQLVNQLTPVQWQELGFFWVDDWERCRTLDSALLCLLAARHLNSPPYWEHDLSEMKAIVQKYHGNDPKLWTIFE